MIDEMLYSYMHEILGRTTTKFYRYMYNIIDWDSRLVGIIGPRGVGKTTMLLQHLKNQMHEEESLYVSADNIYFSTHSLVELADDYIKEGGKHLYIDEVHKYKGWSRELKQIYDVHPDFKVTFTGSSVLEIEKGEADLSRRTILYSMQGMSFREYLEMKYDIIVPSYTLEDILSHRVHIQGLEHPLPIFREYLAHGYYPFAEEGKFEMRMQQVISQTIESDIPQYADMKASTARKLKRMLAIVSMIAPFKPNYSNLSVEIGVNKGNVPEYLTYLERAGMIGQLWDDTMGMRGLGKIEKVYIDNPSLMTVLASGNPDIGTIRETFFYNQMRVNNEVFASRESDFKIDKYTFEVGGKNKGKKQIENVENGFIVKDDIEYGHGIIIPLWQFGFNY